MAINDTGSRVEVLEAPPGGSNAMVPAPDPAPSTAIGLATPNAYTLAQLSPEQFGDLLSAMKLHHQRVKQIQREMMVYGVHYGVPGITKKQWEKSDRPPSIYKPGVELLSKLMRHTLVPEYKIHYGDLANELSPAVTVEAICHVLHAESGLKIASGVGVATSWETKYRWRSAQRVCPDCQQPTLRFVKEARGGSFKGEATWWCPRSNGCGAEFQEKDARIASQQVGRITNPDVLDLLNTLVKVAVKRARADGEIVAGSASDLFTQDLEDLPEGTIPTDKKPAAAAEPDVLTDSQKTMLWRLSKKKLGMNGGSTQTQVELALVERGLLDGTKEITALTKAEASALITRMDALPNAPAPAAAPAAAAAPASPAADTVANRGLMVQKIRDTAALIEAFPASVRHEALATVDGVIYLIGDRELEAVGLKPGPDARVALSDLDSPQLASVLSFMQYSVRELTPQAAALATR